MSKKREWDVAQYIFCHLDANMLNHGVLHLPTGNTKSWLSFFGGLFGSPFDFRRIAFYVKRIVVTVSHDRPMRDSYKTQADVQDHISELVQMILEKRQQYPDGEVLISYGKDYTVEDDRLTVVCKIVICKRDADQMPCEMKATANMFSAFAVGMELF